MALSRRSVLAIGGGGLGALGAKALPSGNADAPSNRAAAALLSAATTTDGRHYAVGFAARHEVFRVPLPTRGHQMAVSPDGARLFATPRRPGIKAFVVDLATQRLAAVCESAPGRHFFGHAVYAPTGHHVLTTENDTQRGRGLVVVREANTLDVVAEYDSGGIGAHEMLWMRDGRTLAVANGGILTHPDQPRKKLNLDAMRPNLSLLDAGSGRLLDQAPALNHQASIRHLAITDDDEAVVAMQYEGPPAADVPLLAAYRANGVLEPLHVPRDRQRNMKQYIGSVALDPATGHAVATCPRANTVTFWSVPDRRYLGEQRCRDAGGAAFDAKAREFVVTNGHGTVIRFSADTLELRHAATTRFPDLKWDNHLTSIRGDHVPKPDVLAASPPRSLG